MKKNYVFPILFVAGLMSCAPLFASGNGVEIFVPIGFFVMVVLIVASVSFSKAYVRGKQYEVFKKYVEAGKEIPADMKLSTEETKRFVDTKQQYLVNGLVNVAVGAGIGLMFYFAGFGDDRLWAIGFIPAFIGIAYLIVYVIEASKKGKDNAEKA